MNSDYLSRKNLATITSVTRVVDSTNNMAHTDFDIKKIASNITIQIIAT